MTNVDIFKKIEALNKIREEDIRDATLVIHDWQKFSNRKAEINDLYVEELKTIFQLQEEK